MAVTHFYLIVLITSSVVESNQAFAPSVAGNAWPNAKEYPDIRGQSIRACGPHIPYPPAKTTFLPYICDPDQMLNESDVLLINQRLHDFSQRTPCQCQRMSQCTMEDYNKVPYKFGFVGAVAILYDIKMEVQNPSDIDKEAAGVAFVRTLRRRWSLGDCGNSVVILYWKRANFMFISSGRVSMRYLNEEEASSILHSVYHKQKDNPVQAITTVIDNIQNEFRGEADTRLDMGYVSLVGTVSVALFFVVVITGCVCAFRCCGNLNQNVEQLKLNSDAVSGGRSRHTSGSKHNHPKEHIVSASHSYRLDTMLSSHTAVDDHAHLQHNHQNHHVRTSSPPAPVDGLRRAAVAQLQQPPQQQQHQPPPPHMQYHQQLPQQQPQNLQQYREPPPAPPPKHHKSSGRRRHAEQQQQFAQQPPDYHTHYAQQQQQQQQHYQDQLPGTSRTGTGHHSPAANRRSPVAAYQGMDSKPPFAHAQLALYDETTIV